MPGTGDCFSVKDACDGGHAGEQQGVGMSGGRIRAVFAPLGPRRCSHFHSHCTVFSQTEASEAWETLTRLADTVWEMPPLAPLDMPLSWWRAILVWISLALPQPYGAVRSNTFYELPPEWHSLHSALVLASTKPSLLRGLEGVRMFGKGMLETEASYYVHLLAYYVPRRPARIQHKCAVSGNGAHCQPEPFRKTKIRENRLRN